MSANTDKLREDGPLPPSELPSSRISTHDKMNGVWVFKPLGATGGGPASAGTGGQLTPVYYLRDEHDPIDVVESWAEANRSNIENAPEKGIRYRLRRHGSEFHDAIDEVIPSGGTDE